MDRLWFTGSGSGVAIMTDSVLRDRLLSFIESEGRSCSFDPGLITLQERLREFMENEARSCSMSFGCATDFGSWLRIKGS